MIILIFPHARHQVGRRIDVVVGVVVVVVVFVVVVVVIMIL